MPKNLLAPELYDSLPEALHDMVKWAPSGHTARRIAALANLSYSMLMNGLSRVESNSTCRLQLESVEPVVAAAGGEGFVAGFFAAKAGGVFVQLPRVVGGDDARAAVMKAMAELGALCRSFDHAQEQGGPAGPAVTDDELRLFLAQANRLMSSASAAMSACRTVLENSKER